MNKNKKPKGINADLYLWKDICHIVSYMQWR